jgi:hypothetical protein
MTTPDKADRLIAAYLAEGPTELPDPSFEAVRGEIDRTRQRARLIPLGIPAISDSARLLAVAAFVLIAFVGVNLLGSRGQRGVGAPGGTASPTPSAQSSPAEVPSPSPVPPPSPAPSRTPLQLPTLGGELQAGTYQLTADFPVLATVEVPAGWSDCTNGPLEQTVCRPDGTGVGLMIVDNVVADPCSNVGLDPPVGPSIHDLADAIAALPGFHATTPIDVTVDGHPATELTVTAPASSQCELLTWMGPDRTNGVALGEVNKLHIVDVGGVRVLIAAAFQPSGGVPDIPADMEGVFESVRFP